MTMKESGRILVIDDEIQIRRIIRLTLESHGFTILESSNGKDGLYKAASLRPDIVVLDLGLPDMDGVEVLKQIREWSKIPVIILSVRDEEKEKVKALESGADDYITKPFGVEELIARIHVALRHINNEDKELKEFINGDLYVDVVNRIVRIKGDQVKLTATEYSILLLFVKNAGKVLTHNFLLKEIWGHYAPEDTQRLRVHMAQLRKKITASTDQKSIITEPAVGYRMILVSDN
jgi:two-component system, OmpR family, KDP operon response regulator KdpE